MKRVRYAFLFVNALIVLCTLGAFAAPVVHPESASFPALMGLLFPVLILANVAAVILWALFKQWYFLISLACLVIGWNRVSGFVQLDPTTGSGATGTVKVGTYNVHQLHNIPEGAKRPQVARRIAEDLSHPDILCFQEGYGIQEMRESFNYQHMFHIGSSQSVVFSRFPIINSGEFEMESYPELSGWADIAMPSDTVRVYALYLSSSRVTEESEQLMKEGNLQDRETWQEIASMLNKYRRASVLRAVQADHIAKHIAESPHPVIVCGDFNDIPQSYTYHRIRSDLLDTFIEQGRGIGATYAGNIPWLRIDYILADPSFEVVQHQVIQLETSDHYPVVAEIRITDL